MIKGVKKKIQLALEKAKLLSHIRKYYSRASLVAQRLRICLPMHRMWVRALVWEDPICHGATKPTRYNY